MPVGVWPKYSGSNRVDAEILTPNTNHRFSFQCTIREKKKFNTKWKQISRLIPLL